MPFKRLNVAKHNLNPTLNYLINKSITGAKKSLEHAILCGLLSCNASDPLYFTLMEKKGQATEKLQDRYGHVILPGELYLEG